MPKTLMVKNLLFFALFLFLSFCFLHGQDEKVVPKNVKAIDIYGLNNFKKEALDILHQFPESDVRQGLEDLVLFVTDRKY